MVLIKRMIIPLSIVLCVAFLSVIGINGYEFVSTTATVEERNRIIIDAGHGGVSVNLILYRCYFFII